MGGEGSMMHANNSLKTNRDLLTKKKRKKVFSGSYASVKMASFPKANKKQLSLFREKLKHSRKEAKIKQVFVFLLILMLIILFVKVLF